MPLKFLNNESFSHGIFFKDPVSRSDFLVGMVIRVRTVIVLQKKFR